MKKIQGLWRGEGEAGILHSLLQNPKKTPNMKIKYGHKQRGIWRKDRGGYGEKTELEKTTISHPKTPNNTKRSNNTRKQLKAPKNNSRWR